MNSATAQEFLTKSNLASWSWKDIQDVYTSIGLVLQSYQLIGMRIEIPQAHIDRTDEENTFILRWHTDIKRCDAQLAALDAEIARRNKLLGVMG